jgi:hypothetical protein
MPALAPGNQAFSLSLIDHPFDEVVALPGIQ